MLRRPAQGRCLNLDSEGGPRAQLNHARSAGSRVRTKSLRAQVHSFEMDRPGRLRDNPPA